MAGWPQIKVGLGGWKGVRGGTAAEEVNAHLGLRGQAVLAIRLLWEPLRPKTLKKVPPFPNLCAAIASS